MGSNWALRSITGLEPAVELLNTKRSADGHITIQGTSRINITPNRQSPKITNGKMYFTMEGHGQTEYWIRTEFAQIVEAGTQGPPTLKK
jgi:hypothetical protein